MRPTLKHQFVPRPRVPPAHPRHNLPAALSSFVGREDEVADVRARLLGAARLVTLIGPGGCGKTRLAVEASARSIQIFPDGVWFVELAPLVDPRLVPQAVASTLGVRADQGQALIRAITSRIAGQRMLIILDTCEHVLASATGPRDEPASPPTGRRDRVVGSASGRGAQALRRARRGSHAWVWFDAS